MPSTSLDRRGRVVTEIDSVRSSAFVCSSMRVKVVLPAPEGDDRISISPRRSSVSPADRTISDKSWVRSPTCIALLDILNLLAELLDFDAQFEADRRQARVIRFGAKRICLATELLRKEIELSPDW